MPEFLSLPWHWQSQIQADECRFCAESPNRHSSLQQYCVGREGREEQSKALQCSQLLWATGGDKAWIRGIWEPSQLWELLNQIVSLGHIQLQVESRIGCCAQCWWPIHHTLLTCNGHPKAIPARNAPTQGHGLHTLHCSTQPIHVATASVCSPSLRKEMHFISANLAV